MNSRLWIRDEDPITGLEIGATETTIVDYDGSPWKRSELIVLRAIAISAASISLLSGLLVLYWFIRMKRSFRHHLIMLLICADFWKASWQLIYPAVVFTRGRVRRTSAFCQATGFFMSMGIEASDFAVLIIAVHSALYIFRPVQLRGEGGLYRYRMYVYSIWIAFPMLLASLAFVNESNAYSSQGTYCYLPARPIWMRLALAWIPRYIILVTILILYASIYIYVRIKFKSFRTNVGFDKLEMDYPVAAGAQQNLAGSSELPDLHSHGLLEAPEIRQETGASDEPFVKKPLDKDNYNMSTPSDLRSFDGAYDLAHPSSQHQLRFSGSTMYPSPPNDTLQEATATAEQRRRRYVISRQLRLLFIYPLVYALMWVPPLISHSLQYTDHFARKPSFALQCIVSFIIPIQCAVDCWLFATREKPWQHIHHSGRQSFWFSFLFWKHDCGDDHEEGRCPQAIEDEEEYRREVWRNTSKKSLNIEQRTAYARRDLELREAQRRMAARNGQLQVPQQAHTLLDDMATERERKSSVGSARSIATIGRIPARRIGSEVNWWDRLIEQEDEEDDDAAGGGDESDELRRGVLWNPSFSSKDPYTPYSSHSGTTVKGEASNPSSSGRDYTSLEVTPAISTTRLGDENGGGGSGSGGDSKGLLAVGDRLRNASVSAGSEFSETSSLESSPEIPRVQLSPPPPSLQRLPR